jgi:hypothetical protein
MKIRSGDPRAGSLPARKDAVRYAGQQAQTDAQDPSVGILAVNVRGAKPSEPAGCRISTRALVNSQQFFVALLNRMDANGCLVELPRRFVITHAFVPERRHERARANASSLLVPPARDVGPAKSASSRPILDACKALCR